MRFFVACSLVAGAALSVAFPVGCGGSNNSSSGFPGGDGGSSSSSGGSSGGGSSGGSSGGAGSGSGSLTGDGGNSSSSGGSTGDGGSTTVTTVYATTDTELYSVDPKTNAVTDIGAFSGQGTGSGSDITDVAVDSKGDIYVNTTAALYKVTLPSGGTGTVSLTQVASLGTTYFYALGFAPAGALDPNNDVLVGGDENGALWSIDTSSGASTQLGTFGANASSKGESWELSGDVVFYIDSSSGKPVGLATIRSCSSGSSSTCGNDYLAQIDMTALKTAYTSGKAASTLLYGIYGGSSTSNGPGTGYYGVYGLAAWNSTVFGFTYAGSSKYTPDLITIDTSSGKGSVQNGTFTFTNGWSGAGVSSKTTVSVPPPPPGMAQ